MGRVAFSKVKVGDEIPSYSTTLQQMMLWMYAGASGDFNPIHVDKEFGENVGLGGTIAHGLSSMGRLGKTITDWLGDPGQLKRFKVRFSAPARPGDTVTFWGRVTDKKVEGGEKLVFLEVGANNQDGVPILTNGEAVVRLGEVKPAGKKPARKSSSGGKTKKKTRTAAKKTGPGKKKSTGKKRAASGKKKTTARKAASRKGTSGQKRKAKKTPARKKTTAGKSSGRRKSGK